MSWRNGWAESWRSGWAKSWRNGWEVSWRSGREDSWRSGRGEGWSLSSGWTRCLDLFNRADAEIVEPEDIGPARGVAELDRSERVDTIDHPVVEHGP